jgi:hypothetical protein
VGAYFPLPGGKVLGEVNKGFIFPRMMVVTDKGNAAERFPDISIVGLPACRKFPVAEAVL